MAVISQNLKEIKEKMASAAVRSGRQPEAVRLVAVSKRVTPERIMEAYAAGQLFFGENYVQEARDKISTVGGRGVIWHFIGQLQSNKANTVAEIFQMVQTVDRLKLAQALDRRLQVLGRKLDILLQVNLGRETQKAGVLPEKVEELLVAINLNCRYLVVKGVMAMPPFFADPESSRPFFRKLRILAEEMQNRGLFPGTDQPELSMGMSADYEVAIEEGSTLVRIGTAIFGSRG